MARRWMSWLALGLVVALPAGAWAVPTLSFDQLVDAGTLSYDGTGGSLVGTGIRFDSVTGAGTPLSPGVTLYCHPSPCLLGFTTGVNTDEPDGADVTYEWAGGGSFTLIGGLNTVSDGTGTQVVAGGSTLLGGTWDSPVVGVVVTPPIGSPTLFVVGSGADTKHASLAAYFGVPVTFQFSNTEISGAFAAGGSGSFSVGVSDADIVNTAVPEAGTAWLLGSSLVALGIASRRRRGGFFLAA